MYAAASIATASIAAASIAAVSIAAASIAAVSIAAVSIAVSQVHMRAHHAASRGHMESRGPWFPDRCVGRVAVMLARMHPCSGGR